MDLKYFFECLARPPHDPMSLHPSLLNAIYAISCCFGGNLYHDERDYFVSEARRGLETSLQDMERLTHSLWATVILSSYYTNAGRIPEAYAMISGSAKFALACGLDGVTPLNRSSAPEFPLLLPPTSDAEARDRVCLSRAIYMTERSLSMLTGFPSVYRTAMKTRPDISTAVAIPEGSYGEEPHDILSVRWISLIGFDVQPPDSHLDVIKDSYRELLDLVHSDTSLTLKSMQIYERIERLALQPKGCYSTQNVFSYNELTFLKLTTKFAESLRTSEAQEELRALEEILPIFHKMLPSLLDNKYLEQFEILSLVNPHLVIAHTTYHGSMLLLYTVLSSVTKDARSRALQFEAARSLADVYSQLRGSQGIKRILSFILPMVSTRDIHSELIGCSDI